MPYVTPHAHSRVPHPTPWVCCLRRSAKEHTPLVATATAQLTQKTAKSHTPTPPQPAPNRKPGPAFHTPHLGVDVSVGLSKQHAPLAVASQHVAHPETGQHTGGNRAGEGALGSRVHVLCRRDSRAAVGAWAGVRCERLGAGEKRVKQRGERQGRRTRVEEGREVGKGGKWGEAERQRTGEEDKGRGKQRGGKRGKRGKQRGEGQGRRRGWRNAERGWVPWECRHMGCGTIGQCRRSEYSHVQCLRQVLLPPQCGQLRTGEARSTFTLAQPPIHTTPHLGAQPGCGSIQLLPHKAEERVWRYDSDLNVKAGLVLRLCRRGGGGREKTCLSRGGDKFAPQGVMGVMGMIANCEAWNGCSLAAYRPSPRDLLSRVTYPLKRRAPHLSSTQTEPLAPTCVDVRAADAISAASSRASCSVAGFIFQLPAMMTVRLRTSAGERSFADSLPGERC
eukprot:46925-Chlamydomonas_euryale.AAC.1